MNIEEIINEVKSGYKLWEYKSFPLVNGGLYHLMYFHDKVYDDPKQLRLFGDDEWDSMKKNNYQK
jgi:hypothetical protein